MLRAISWQLTCLHHPAPGKANDGKASHEHSLETDPFNDSRLVDQMRT